MPTLVDRLRAKSCRFYSVNDRLGVKTPVFRGVLAWVEEIGDGDPTATYEQILPTPSIRNLSAMRSLSVHGETADGDLMLSGIAHDAYSRDFFSNGSGLEQNFWLISGRTYTVKDIEEKYISWSITLRLSKINHWKTFDPVV